MEADSDDPKLDCWGLPYFVDEWGIQTEYDEEPIKAQWASGGIITGSITAGKIMTGSISSSHISTGVAAMPGTSSHGSWGSGTSVVLEPGESAGALPKISQEALDKMTKHWDRRDRSF